MTPEETAQSFQTLQAQIAAQLQETQETRGRAMLARNRQFHEETQAGIDAHFKAVQLQETRNANALRARNARRRSKTNDAIGTEPTTTDTTDEQQSE